MKSIKTKNLNSKRKHRQDAYCGGGGEIFSSKGSERGSINSAGNLGKLDSSNLDGNVEDDDDGTIEPNQGNKNQETLGGDRDSWWDKVGIHVDNNSELKRWLITTEKATKNEIEVSVSILYPLV